MTLPQRRHWRLRAQLNGRWQERLAHSEAERDRLVAAARRAGVEPVVEQVDGSVAQYRASGAS